MRILRHYGIYNIPGINRSVYLIPNGENTYLLFDCEFGTRIPPRFAIAANGHIINWYSDFPIWTVDDLIDTGETYEK